MRVTGFELPPLDIAASGDFIKLTPVTFATLPPAGTFGRVACVSNSTTNVWGAIITGGGANQVLAMDNGVNWTVVGT